MTTQKRAKIGGEIGANGEFYDGGRFIATTERHKTQGSRPKKVSRQEIEPYKWEVPPAEGLRSIFSHIIGIFGRYDYQTHTFTFFCSDQTMAFYGFKREVCERWISRYNAGERWAPRSEF